MSNGLENMNALMYASKSVLIFSKVSWLMSNTFDIHAKSNMMKGFYDIFDNIFLSNEIGLIKPDMEKYKYVVKKLDTSPKKCVFIDDKIRNLVPARDLGIIVIRYETLNRFKEILNEYSSKIEIIKDDVYKRLDSFKSNDIDIYQIIKLWEDNFNRKRQQLTFLISLLINKLFKSFKELIDKEGILFATITEITEQTENFEELPLNFALSSFLAEKLTEDELRERINEINSKINHLNNSLGLYQIEISKLETILSNRVKFRKGVTESDVQCTVCHKNLNFARDKVITCPFCGSTYHYLCVAFWLSKYNSCPMCQNNFLEPHSDLYEGQEDQELEKY